MLKVRHPYEKKTTFTVFFSLVTGVSLGKNRWDSDSLDNMQQHWLTIFFAFEYSGKHRLRLMVWPTCAVPVVLLRTVLEEEEAVSLLRLLSWLRQWGSGWACRALKDMEPIGWQDTERGHTGMATVMHAGNSGCFEEGYRSGQREGLWNVSKGVMNRSTEWQVGKKRKEEYGCRMN